MNIVKSENMIVVPESHPAHKTMLDKLCQAKAQPGAIIYLTKEEHECWDLCTFIELEKNKEEFCRCDEPKDIGVLSDREVCIKCCKEINGVIDA